jgi:hypothetical protein
MPDQPTLTTPVAKRTVRYVETTMTPEVRASAGLRHTRTLTKWRAVKAAKKDAVKDFTAKLDELDMQALSLENATKEGDGVSVALPMVCKEVPLYREERKVWMLAIYRIDEDPLTNQEVELFEKWEDLPEDLLHLNQGSLPFDGRGDDPDKGGGGGGGHDPLKDVDFPGEDEQGGDGKADGKAEPPPGPVQPGDEKTKGRGRKGGGKKKS